MSSTEQPILEATPAAPVQEKRSLLSYLRGRAMIALTDQAVVSIATFATGFLVSRVSKDQAGLYAMSMGLWVILSEAHNSLVSNPHMLRVPKLSGGALRRFNGATLVHQLLLSSLLTFGTLLAANAAWALGQAEEALILLVTAIGTLPVTLRNYARNFCFATRDTTMALRLDVGVSALQIALVIALALAHKLTAVNAILALGLANFVSAGVWLAASSKQFNVRRALLVPVARRNWRLGKWLFASSMMWVAGLYLYPWVINAMRDTAEAGVFGACALLASLGNPLVSAMQNYLGPAIAHDHDELSLAAFHRMVMRRTVQFAALVLPVSIAMALCSQFLLDLIFKGQYAGEGRVAAVLVFAIVAQAGSFTLSRGLFCLGYARVDTLANVVPIIILLSFGVWAVAHYGALGAAWALLLSQLLGFATRLVAFHKLKPIGGAA
jgi:O-antigen/teichoic acid export membrane protein